jgi:hypothetical protein
MIVKLKNGLETIIDDEFAYLNDYEWDFGTGYAYTKIGKDYIAMQNMILPNDNKKLVIDHINRDKLDNRKSNLRLATKSQNVANSKLYKTNTSGFRGVTFDKANDKWLASIKHNGIYIALGRYEDVEEAAIQYDVAAIQLFGEFSNLNMI